MEFLLPQELQQHLYVSTTPKPKENSKPNQGNKSSKSTAKRFPLGAVYGLIPDAYVQPNVFAMAVENINESDKIHRSHVFTSELGGCNAILYHYAGCWTAAWHANENDNYLYGVSICFRNTDSNFEKSPIELHKFFEPIVNYNHGIYNQSFGYSLKRIKVKRTEYIVATRLVSLEDIKSIKFKRTESPNSNTDENWYHLFGNNSYNYSKRPPSSHLDLFLGYQYTLQVSQWKSYKHHYDRVVTRFEEKLRVKANSLSECSVFGRLCTPNVIPFVFDVGGYNSLIDNDSPLLNQDNLTLNHAAVVDIINKSNDSRVIRYKGAPLDVFCTPFFAKKVNSICSEINDLWQKSYNIPTGTFLNKGKQITSVIASIHWVLSVWPDCPIDYIQNSLDDLINVKYLLSDRRIHLEYDKCPHMWLRDNMPVKTFFNMITKQSAKESTSAHNNPLHSFGRQLDDTINMIGECLAKDVSVSPPSRWRIDEFHDHAMAESWKVKNENTLLPQFLLPDPIQVHFENNKWTFFQPKDTHQLASWGRAVRNCVGSSYYADGIKENKHFIVLAMLDNKPMFTVQLAKRDASCASLTVTQIKEILNQPLSNFQESEYAKVFQDALAIRAAQLTPALKPDSN